MGLEFAHAFGAHTVLFTTSASKSEDARRTALTAWRNSYEREIPRPERGVSPRKHV
jgi:hypothetical protein